MLETFYNYVSHYDMHDLGIFRKYSHCLRVMKLCQNISKYEKMSETEINICTTIGLLHDYARFEQWKKFQTYDDFISFDHGDYGVKLLFDDLEIEKFTLDKNIYPIIKDAIKNHNKYEIGNTNYRKYCEVIRDADKLDILHLYTTPEIDVRETESEITEEVSLEFWSHQSIHNANVKVVDDKIVVALAFIFNFQSDYCFIYMKENHVLEDIFESRKYKEKLRPFFEEAKKYIEENYRRITC